MSLTTHSRFYFGHTVTGNNFYLDFSEGAGELTATIQVGAYTLTDIAIEIERALNAAGALDYEVTVDRATRKITISASGDFELLVATGSHEGNSVFETLGFTQLFDLTGTDTYEGNEASGSEYTTQFILQSHVSSEHFRGTAFGVVNKSASGKVEVVTFGEESFTEFNFKYVTNLSGTGPIRERPTGLEDLLTFIRYLITKAPVEFMPNEDDPETFEPVLLESTTEDSKGLDYKLRELYGQGLPGFFETGLIKFRLTGPRVVP